MTGTGWTLTADSAAIALAPMAGAADRAFRELCRAEGAAFVCSEMVSAKGICMGDRKSAELMALSAAEQPAGIQLFGREPACFAQAALAALEHNPAFLELNMGCPAHKIAGHGSGAALMREPALAEAITRATVEALRGAGAALPVSVKMRAGWDAESRNAVEIARRCAAAGAAWLTVHGRTRQQMYAPPVDLESIRQVKLAVGIPVLGNGDVTDGASAAAMLAQTGCDGILVGRGALGRPWVFRQIAAFLAEGVRLPEPAAEERMQMLLRHIRQLCAYKGERIGMREARKHAAWYTKGLRGAAKLRNEMTALQSIGELEALAVRIIELEGTA
ncbi:MAG: tRNA dihydrouridine synthase DusB [Oscillospiraceae bacterium]|jgi:nifR3 family TIM-barrel protein|nr:tRNA dihydrouridine synthase DusB [Oscillospiraceae bacterium]